MTQRLVLHQAMRILDWLEQVELQLEACLQGQAVALLQGSQLKLQGCAGTELPVLACKQSSAWFQRCHKELSLLLLLILSHVRAGLCFMAHWRHAANVPMKTMVNASGNSGTSGPWQVLTRLGKALPS